MHNELVHDERSQHAETRRHNGESMGALETFLAGRRCRPAIWRTRRARTCMAILDTYGS
ncbi:MAG: hypothetical protein PVF43_16675 [Candidatus Eiseniibacteriota bacterium]|jgi:hypothetical protein